MTKRIALLFALLLLAGCEQRLYGGELTERGRVVQTCYVPPGHGSGTGVGLSTGNGSTVVTSNTVDIPARYAVVFECQHGRFAVNGHEAWMRAREGEDVLIHYREVYVTGSGEGLRRVVDLDFLYAEPLP